MSMREQKRELEELLSYSIELQRKQLLLPQEKVCVPRGCTSVYLLSVINRATPKHLYVNENI